MAGTNNLERSIGLMLHRGSWWQVATAVIKLFARHRLILYFDLSHCREGALAQQSITKYRLFIEVKSWDIE